MTPPKYVHTDYDGDTLEITTALADPTTVYLFTPVNASGITRDRLPDVVHAMYRAAGLDPFFLLPSGTPPQCRHEDYGVTVQPSPDTRPGNQPGVFLHTRMRTTRLTCGEARHIAWHLMLHAQQAEQASKVDPADAAAVTSYFKDATDEEIAGFLTRFEIRERSTGDDSETDRSAAWTAGGGL